MDASINATYINMSSTGNNERYIRTWETDSVTNSETKNSTQSVDIWKAIFRDNVLKSSLNVSNNPLFVNHYSEDSKDPSCEKSSKPRKRHRQDNEFIDWFVLDKPRVKAKRSEASDAFSGVKQNRIKKLTKPWKQYKTKRRREAALLNSRISQTFAAVPQTNVSLEGQFKDMQTENPDSRLVTSVNKSEDIESVTSTTDTNNYSSATESVISAIKSYEKNNLAVNDPKPFNFLLHSSTAPSNKSSAPPRAPVVAQQTRNEDRLVYGL